MGLETADGWKVLTPVVRHPDYCPSLEVVSTPSGRRYVCREIGSLFADMVPACERLSMSELTSRTVRDCCVDGQYHSCISGRIE